MKTLSETDLPNIIGGDDIPTIDDPTPPTIEFPTGTGPYAPDPIIPIDLT